MKRRRGAVIALSQVLLFRGLIGAAEPPAPVYVRGGELQAALDRAPAYATVVADRAATIEIASTVRITKPLTLAGLNARMKPGVGKTPMLLVAAEGVRIRDFLLEGNAESVPQSERAPLIEVRRGRFVIENGEANHSSKDGVMITPVAESGDIEHGVIRNLTTRGTIRDSVSIGGAGDQKLFVRHLVVENIRGYGSRLRGPVEVSDGSEYITVRDVYAESCAYGVDVQDHNRKGQVNRFVIIDGVHVKDTPIAIRTANHDFGHDGLTIRNVTGTDWPSRTRFPLQITNTRNVLVENVRIHAAPGEFSMRVANSANVTLRNLTFTECGHDGAALVLDDVDNALVDNVVVAGKAQPRVGVLYRVLSDRPFGGLRIQNVQAQEVRDAGIVVENSSKSGSLASYSITGNLATVRATAKAGRAIVRDNLAAAELAQPSPVYAADWPEARTRCRPVPLNNVRASGFLGRRIQANARSVMEGLKSPVPRGFEARAAGQEPGPETRRLAADSDLYKWMEGASYTLALTRDPAIGRELERIAGLVIACQQKDGYINTQTPPNRRFDPAINHDLYTAGHFFEAAAAHYRVTGKRHLLDAAKRWADYLIAEHRAGNPYFETAGRKEHSEYELGLLRLARATGDARYLDFSKTLARLIPVGRELLAGRHAVRVNYLLTGYADLFLETGAEEWTRSLTAVWDEIVATRSFVTGGVSVHEAYQKEPHWLPQSTDHPRRDIAETCTSISLAMFAWRLHSITGDSRYFDQIERILYNHYLGAVSLDHLATFYYNPLRMLAETKGKTDHDGPLTRRTRLPEIHSTACCVTNEWRFFGALSEYLFSYDRDGLYVNLYTSGSVRQKLPSGAEAAVTVETQYPHEGRIRLTIGGEKPQRFALRLRVPAWCASARLTAGGGPPRAVPSGSYAVIEREWKPGDRVILDLDMPVRIILPRPEEKENAGQGVLARGPLVYCLEQVDSRFPIAQARLNLRPEDAARRVKARWRPNLLEGVYVLEAPGVAGPLTLVPFYARANRAGDNRWLTFLPLETRNRH